MLRPIWILGLIWLAVVKAGCADNFYADSGAVVTSDRTLAPGSSFQGRLNLLPIFSNISLCRLRLTLPLICGRDIINYTIPLANYFGDGFYVPIPQQTIPVTALCSDSQLSYFNSETVLYLEGVLGNAVDLPVIGELTINLLQVGQHGPVQLNLTGLAVGAFADLNCGCHIATTTPIPTMSTTTPIPTLSTTTPIPTISTTTPVPSGCPTMPQIDITGNFSETTFSRLNTIEFGYDVFYLTPIGTQTFSLYNNNLTVTIDCGSGIDVQTTITSSNVLTINNAISDMTTPASLEYRSNLISFGADCPADSSFTPINFTFSANLASTLGNTFTNGQIFVRINGVSGDSTASNYYSVITVANNCSPTPIATMTVSNARHGRVPLKANIGAVGRDRIRSQ